MYTVEERSSYFDKVIQEFELSDLVEGIVQLGSGVIGYKDEYSDIDLMIATSRSEKAQTTRDFIRETLKSFDSTYIKEKQFSRDILLVIAIMDNGLELNVSIVPRELLTVRSPLWKVIVDKTGLVTEKMNSENDYFLKQPIKYNVGIDIPFEFVYCALAFEKELKRGNQIYALKMLEEMRNFILIIQALNEGKKLHQFKAYGSLHPTFIQAYLSTFPNETTDDNLKESAEKLKELFVGVLKQSSSFTMDNDLEQLLYKCNKIKNN